MKVLFDKFMQSTSKNELSVQCFEPITIIGKAPSSQKYVPTVHCIRKQGAFIQSGFGTETSKISVFIG
jgi:hypothetical protein